MKGIFNCSTNVTGGGVQNAANFIMHAITDNNSDVEWCYVMSPQVKDTLKKFGYKVNGLCLNESPSRSKKSRRALLQYCNALSPHFVYTMAGPAYVAFEQFHILGCSEPYVTNSDYLALRCGRSWVNTVKTYLHSCYKTHHFMSADYWIFQTKASRDGFVARTGISVAKTVIIGNAIGRAFEEKESASEPRGDCKTAVLVPCAGYPHKALHLIPLVASEVAKRLPTKDITFYFTLAPESKIAERIHAAARKLGVESRCKNLGTFSYHEAPRIYQSCDLVFIPSVLEVFSTSYLETMQMRKPLLVADRPFSREICGSYASYFRPMSASDAAEKIMDITERCDDSGTRDELARERLGTFGTYSQRYDAILSHIRSVIK